MQYQFCAIGNGGGFSVGSLCPAKREKLFVLFTGTVY